MSDAVGLSARLMGDNGEKKRPSDDQDSNEHSGKRIKIDHESSNHEGCDTEKMTRKFDSMGLYAAEMFAAHVARQHVLSCVVNSKWFK